jgi:hypothetical protein
VVFPSASSALLVLDGALVRLQAGRGQMPRKFAEAERAELPLRRRDWPKEQRLQKKGPRA